jgi:putative (di)nucleoside polyphosphate hydrolase
MNEDNVQLEIIKTGLAWLTLALGWVLGQKIIAKWDIIKKQRELDIETAMQFNKFYGEFKAVSRLWRVKLWRPINSHGKRSEQLTFPGNTPFELLVRATAAEGGVEAIIVKLATERVLNEKDIKTLGLFRQAYQELRHAIREGKPLLWTYGTPEYTLYNDLASKVTCIIVSNKRKEPNQNEAPQVLRKISKIRPDEWEKEVKRMSLPPEYYRAGVGAIIVNSQGLILALERAHITGAWQLPQGGLELSEQPEQAVLREVAEETGISGTDLELLYEYPEPLVYDLPVNARSEKTGRGQVQYWFLYRFHGNYDAIDVKSGGEFRAWKWLPFQRLVNEAVDFRKPLYRKLADLFGPYISTVPDEVISGNEKS